MNILSLFKSNGGVRTSNLKKIITRIFPGRKRGRPKTRWADEAITYCWGILKKQKIINEQEQYDKKDAHNIELIRDNAKVLFNED